MKKNVYNVGINDANYRVTKKINGKKTICPYYRVWSNMMKRCYCAKYQKHQPTYKGCTVTKDWLIFSNFRLWMENQDWRGKELDKDIINLGNKVYSQYNCIFVTRAINSLLNPRKSSARLLPTGVWYDRNIKKYRAEITIYCKKQPIGIYKNPIEAGLAYRKVKSEHIKSVANMEIPILRDALIRHSELLLC